MDPNETLKAIRKRYKQLLANAEDGEATVSDALDMAYELAEHVESLDTWLTRKGFLPSAWERK